MEVADDVEEMDRRPLLLEYQLPVESEPGKRHPANTE